MQIIQSYLKKRGITGPWRIDPKPQRKFHHSVVIPAYGEAELLPHTLTSLDKNDASILKDTLVIVVVNNAVNSPKSILKNNQITLKMLKSSHYNYTLGIVDAERERLVEEMLVIVRIVCNWSEFKCGSDAFSLCIVI